MPERIVRRALWKLNIRDGRFTKIDGLRAMMGLNGQDPVTIEILSSMVHPDHQEAFFGLFEAPYEKDWAKEGEIGIIWKDGSEHYLHVIVFPHEGGADAPLKGLAEIVSEPEGVGRIEELRCQIDQTEEGGEIAAGESQRLIYHLSHDLQAPIRNVVGFSQALMERHSQGLDAKGKDYLHRVVQESNRMNLMIAGLLRMSRIGSIPMSVHNIDLSAIVRGKAEQMKVRHNRSVAFQVQDGVRVDADAYMIDILMEELLDNACKFSMHRADPTVWFGLLDCTPTPTFYVRDNGVGFDSDYSGKLFGPFQRLHSEDEFPGIGIGLSVAYAIIRRHGGRIWGESVVDGGATFFFTMQ